MKMLLAELRLVLDNKEKELADVFHRRDGAQFNIYKLSKGSKDKELTHDAHEFTVDELTARAEVLAKEIRTLRIALARGNMEAKVDFTVDGLKICLLEAIILIKEMRKDFSSFKAMGEKKTAKRIVDPLASRFTATSSSPELVYEEVTEPAYDTKKYREKAKKLESIITKLEVAITAANHTYIVDVEGVTIPEFTE